MAISFKSYLRAGDSAMSRAHHGSDKVGDEAYATAGITAHEPLFRGERDLLNDLGDVAAA